MDNLKFTQQVLNQGMNSIVNTIGNFGWQSGTGIRIFKGAQITAAQLNTLNTVAALNSLTNAQLLLTCTVSTNVSLLNNTMKIPDTAYVSASASGDASWFICYATNSDVNAGNINSAFMGTITSAGGNGDLRLTSVALVIGQLYRVNAINLAIPLEFTF